MRRPLALLPLLLLAAGAALPAEPAPMPQPAGRRVEQPKAELKAIADRGRGIERRKS